MKFKLSRTIVFISFLLFVSIIISAQETEKYSCINNANYQINAKLDPDKKIIKGEEILTWKNITNISTDELHFHLYYNAFRNNLSTFIKEGERDFKPKRKLEEWGYCEVKEIKVLPKFSWEETDLIKTFEYIQPDDGNIYDKTVFRVKLPRPVAPKEEIKLSISFVSKIPRTITRSGYIDDYFFVAQWFPKIGVLEETGWNCHQYHTSSEFFSDYGTYDVKITVPSKFIVGASGQRMERIENNDGTTTYRYWQDCIHDFAWVAWPHFILREQEYEFMKGKKVKIFLYLTPEHKHLENRYFDATKYGIKYYSEWFGPYPYPTITCVDPLYNSGSGGMEYPTLFTGGASVFSPIETLSPEGVTIHEFGHQLWYGLVGNNEFENAWLDEGFNSYSEARVQSIAYRTPKLTKRFFRIPLIYRDIDIDLPTSPLWRYRSLAKADILHRNAWEYMNRNSYGLNAYAKTELMLWTLERILGWEKFQKIMSTYYTKWRFRHPKPQDFFDVVKEITGDEMRWFFDQFVFGSDVLDYSVEKISSEQDKEPMGFLDDEEKKIAEKIKKERKTKKDKVYISEVLVRRLGEVKMPVEILITFENGEKILEKWDGQYRWKKFKYEKSSKLKSAVVDPYNKLVIEIQKTNNSKIMKPCKTGAYKWALRWMLWLQHLLETITFLL